MPETEVTHIEVVNLVTPPASPQAVQKKRSTPNTAHVPRKRPVPAVFSKPHSICTVLGLLHTGPFGPGAAQLEWSDINSTLVTVNWSVPRAMALLADVHTDTAIEPICIIHRELWPVVDARALVNDTGDEWGVLTQAGIIVLHGTIALLNAFVMLWGLWLWCLQANRTRKLTSANAGFRTA